jgi:hypothetical protein
MLDDRIVSTQSAHATMTRLTRIIEYTCLAWYVVVVWSRPLALALGLAALIAG